MFFKEKSVEFIVKTVVFEKSTEFIVKNKCFDIFKIDFIRAPQNWDFT